MNCQLGASASRVFLALLCAALVPIVGLKVAPAQAQTPLTMKLGHDSPIDFPYQPAAEWFKKELESKSNGRIKVQIFPDAQLGDESAMLNGLSIGSVDAMYLSTAPISESVKEIDLFSLPFLFKDVDQALRVANGPVGKSLEAKMAPALKAQTIGWASVGERDMWNSKRPIKTVADLKGLKMRVQQSAIQKDTYAALGAQATPMSFSELFTALQTGVVDGADNGPLDIEASKFYQVTKYLSLTRHFILLTPMLVSDKFLAQVSPQDKALILDLGKQSLQIVTDEAKKQNETALTKLKTQGLQIFEISDADRQQLVSLVKPVYSSNADRVGGMNLIEQVLGTP